MDWLTVLVAVLAGALAGALAALVVDARLRRRRLEERPDRWRRRLGIDESELGR